ncbi:MAG: phosphate/phosphite/phosphonate ABC transporter substrate-binding protein [Nitriliruptoraceae bacterium]
MRTRKLAILITAVVMLAACGSGDDGSDDAVGEADPAADTAEEAEPTDEEEEAAEDDRADWPEELVFGFVPSREADVLVDSADELAAVLSDATGIPVEPFISQDYVGLVEAMASEQAHIGAFGPLALVRAIDRAGVEIILQSERRGTLSYHTQYMTNDPDKYCDDAPQADEDGFLWCNGTLEASEGPVGEEAIARIDGSTAFVDPSSASGYLIPALQMIEQGHELNDIASIFSGGHDNSVNAVYHGDVEVGLSFDDARGIMLEELPDVGEKVVVFAFSDEIPNDGMAVIGGLPEDLKLLIQQALVEYSDTEEGQEVLFNLYEIDGLAPATSSTYDVMRRADAELGDQFDG